MKKLKILFYQFYVSPAWRILMASYLIAIVGGMGWYITEQNLSQKTLIAEVSVGQDLSAKLDQATQALVSLQSEDQIVKNASLSAEMKAMQNSFAEGANLFEQRADLSLQGAKIAELDKMLAKFLANLGERKWQEASQQAKLIRVKIDELTVAMVPKIATPPGGESANNSLPATGYSRQRVSTGRGDFVIAAVVAAGAHAIVETMDDPSCAGNCEARSLAEHVGKDGGFAGINGAYFCPPDYAQCQGKTNSFDTLAVNGRTKGVFNQANNVYSTIPLVAMYNNSLSFYDQTVQWGVDTSGGGAIANFPRLLRDGNIATEDNGSKGTRGFIGMKDGSIVIGHVYSASYADTAEVLKTLGLQNALNLDGGGSSALWYEGAYKVGPGRLLPTAIVLVR